MTGPELLLGLEQVEPSGSEISAADISAYAGEHCRRRTQYQY